MRSPDLLPVEVLLPAVPLSSPIADLLRFEVPTRIQSRVFDADLFVLDQVQRRKGR
jgi:hypothetical protein